MFRGRFESGSQMKIVNNKEISKNDAKSQYYVIKLDLRLQVNKSYVFKWTIITWIL